MFKLPVFRTIGQVFGFVIERRFFTLLRLIWFPAVISTFSSLMEPLYLYCVYGTVPQKVQHQVLGINVKFGPEFNDPALLTIQIVDLFLQVVLGAIIAVCVHRMILLDDRKPGEYFYLRFTGEELRYVVAGILYFLLTFIAASIPFAGHIYWVASHGGTVPLSLHEVADIFGLLPSLGGSQLYPVAALSFLFGLGALARFGLVFPIIVAEGRVSFLRSWVVTRGNFLRLVGFWITVTILATVLILVMVALGAFAVVGMISAVFAGGQTVGALSILILSVPAAVSLLVYLVVGITTFIAAMSFSYRALNDERNLRQPIENV